MDYSYFDALIDSVFVLNDEKGVVYCNEAAATLLESSVRRLTKGRPIHEFVIFNETDIFLNPDGKAGQSDPFPMTELSFKRVKSGTDGKAQIAVHPFTEPSGDKRWIAVARDVTLEEVLHAKYHKQLEEKEDVIIQLREAQKQLEAYSKNLEQMVEERTLEVKRANVMLNAIMDSLGQGFLVFDKDGICGKFFTKACLDILETEPVGKEIWKVMNLDEKDSETFKMWMQAVFSQSLDFESLKGLAPQDYQHSAGRNIRLDYFPIFSESGATEHIVLVATDWTAEFEANVALEKEKQYAKMVLKLVSSRQQFEKFLNSCDEVVHDLKREVESDKELDIQWAFRVLHTLEGEAGTFSVRPVWEATRAPQELLEPYKSGEKAAFDEDKAEFVELVEKISLKKKDFVNLNKDLFDSLGIGKAQMVEVSCDDIETILDLLNTKNIDPGLVESIEDRLKSQPARNLFSHYEDVVATVAGKMNKMVKPVNWQGVDTLIRTDRYERLASSFVHAFRNAVDHGIESAEDREMLGKPRDGELTFRVESFQDQGQAWLRFELKDDGQGIHAEQIRKKLQNQNPDKDYSAESDEDIIQHVFDSGLSTLEEVGEFSGRGVGMNAIKEEAEALGGRVVMESDPPNGSVLRVEIPVQAAVTISKAA